jgi:hypothetical protein
MACPFPFAPPLIRLVGPPGTPLLLIALHRHRVEAAPALTLAGGLHGRLRQWVLRQHGLEPGQQARLVRIAECQLHLPAGNLEVHVDRRRGFGQSGHRLRTGVRRAGRLLLRFLGRLVHQLHRLLGQQRRQHMLTAP